MPTNDTITPSNSNNSPTNADALDSVSAELMKIPTSSLRPINLDIPSIILTVMGALGALRALRALIATVLGEAAAAHVDKLPIYAQAASQAHTNYLIALAPADMQVMSDELGVKRDVLVSEATTLVKRKYLKAGELGELRGNVGFTNQIFDVFQVVTLLANGDMVGHTGVLDAAVMAVEAVDLQLGRLLPVIERLSGALIVTADHGNADEMLEIDKRTKAFLTDASGKRAAKTSHTLNAVPFHVYAPSAPALSMVSGVAEPGLANVAATTLTLLGYEAPHDYERSLVDVGR